LGLHLSELFESAVFLGGGSHNCGVDQSIHLQLVKAFFFFSGASNSSLPENRWDVEPFPLADRRLRKIS